MSTDTMLFVLMGVLTALWSAGLSIWLAYLDTAQRRSALAAMNAALASLLERSGERRRQQAHAEQHG